MNAEFEPYTPQSEDETGFSEEQLSLDVEVGAGEWQNLRTLHAFKQKSRLARIALLYQAFSHKLNTLVSKYETTVDEKRRSELEKEIHVLQVKQDITLNCLFWEQNNELEKDMIPQEIWEMIG